jgi:hypothetical protein
MAALLKSRTLSVSLNCDPKRVYEFVSKPENLPKWAKMFCRSIKKSNGGWIVETPQGPVNVRFSKRNDFGVLDHYVSSAPGVEVFVPMRVVPNGSGSEVLLTLFQPAGMSGERFAEDIRWVEQDLHHLKSIMEGQSKR